MITEDVPEKYSDLDFTPPTAAQNNAQKVIDWKDEHGEDEVDAMNQTGWERAHQLADGDELSPDVVDRMASFARHEKNKDVSDEYEDEPWKDHGHVAWLGWGGDEGIEWAQDMADKMDKRDKQNESMKLTESKLRKLVREELRFSGGRTSAPKGTANYHIHQFVKKVANVFASRLQSAYEIQFEDALEGNMSVSADFKIYNSQQDIYKEGNLSVFDVGGSIKVELRGGELGSRVSSQQVIINESFDYDEAPLGQIDIVSAAQVIAGR